MSSLLKLSTSTFALWSRMRPGYSASRDCYCERRLHGRDSARGREAYRFALDSEFVPHLDVVAAIQEPDSSGYEDESGCDNSR